MLDLMVLAFQMDKTRIATCMLNNDLSQMNFGFLDGVQGSLHLDLTHNGRDPALEAMYLKRGIAAFSIKSPKTPGVCGRKSAQAIAESLTNTSSRFGMSNVGSKLRRRSGRSISRPLPDLPAFRTPGPSMSN